MYMYKKVNYLINFIVDEKVNFNLIGDIDFFVHLQLKMWYWLLSHTTTLLYDHLLHTLCNKEVLYRRTNFIGILTLLTDYQNAKNIKYFCFLLDKKYILYEKLSSACSIALRLCKKQCILASRILFSGLAFHSELRETIFISLRISYKCGNKLV